MTAIVCGVIIEAPRPWKMRATMSMATLPDRPHHSEEAVKTVSPAR
jgi:hypothetical protein